MSGETDLLKKAMALSIASLILSTGAIASCMIQSYFFGNSRSPESPKYSRPFHWQLLFLRIPHGWTEVADEKNLVLHSEDGLSVISFSLNQADLDLRSTDEVDLIDAARKILGTSGDTMIRTNTHSLWPAYYVATSLSKSGKHFAKFKAVVFMPGTIAIVDGEVPNEVNSQNSSESNPSGVGASEFGSVLQSLTIAVNISSRNT